MSAFNYSLLSLHKFIATHQIMLKLTETHAFYPIFNSNMQWTATTICTQN